MKVRNNMANEKIWLSSPTMHGDEIKYMKESYDTNWMSTVGENINEVENRFVKKLYLSQVAAVQLVANFAVSLQR